MPGVFEIFATAQFSAAHRLEGYPGDCCRVHGHNWVVEAYVRCRDLDEVGIGLDFRDLKKALAEVLDRLDHADLNSLPALAQANPTAENLARYIYKELAARLDSDRVKVARVKVGETPGTGAFYWEE